MALDMRVEVTSGREAVQVPDDIAVELQEAYDTLSKLPVNRQITVDFPDAASARLFARMGRAWAASQEPELTFERKGDIKANPNRVSFRIYTPKPRGALTDAQKVQRAATRAANKAAKAGK